MIAKDARPKPESVAHAIVRGEPARVLSINAGKRTATVFTKGGERSVPLAEIRGLSTISLFGSGG
jgi:hypothetical protein